MSRGDGKRELKTYKGRPVSRQEPLPVGEDGIERCLLIYVKSNKDSNAPADREIITSAAFKKYGRKQRFLPVDMPDKRQLAAQFEG